MWMKWCQVILCHKTWQSWQGQIKDAHHARYNSYLNPRQKWGYFGVVPGSRVHCRLGCSTYCSLPRYLCFPGGSLCDACGIWRFYILLNLFSYEYLEWSISHKEWKWCGRKPINLLWTSFITTFPFYGLSSQYWTQNSLIFYFCFQLIYGTRLPAALVYFITAWILILFGLKHFCSS